MKFQSDQQRKAVMAKIASGKMQLGYHTTPYSNIHSIRKKGIIPRPAWVTKTKHFKAIENEVPAVWFGTGKRKIRTLAKLKSNEHHYNMLMTKNRPAQKTALLTLALNPKYIVDQKRKNDSRYGRAIPPKHILDIEVFNVHKTGPDTRPSKGRLKVSMR